MDKNTYLREYAADMTKQQIDAITQVDGPTLLLAVPGSGKTTTLVLRAGYLTKCANIPARQMLILTFSRMAASEMRERYAKLFGTEGMPHFSTIHSFCVQVLRRYQQVCMIEEQERASLLKAVYWQHSSNADAFSENTIRLIDSGIAYAKNMLLDTEGIQALTSVDEDFPAIFRAYQEALRVSGKMDFDDQLVSAYRLLLDHPQALRELQEEYRYICVDEAQDTSYVQHRILYLLAQRYRNIFMVGDEDQSIYGFRAAYPDVLLEFERIYPGGRILLMEKNFRSTPTIIKASNTLIGRVKKRHAKTACAAKPGGEAIRFTVLEDLSRQYAYITDSLMEHDGQGRTQAVLYRNNESALPLIDMLLRRGIPFACRDSAAAAINGTYMQQVMALLEFSFKPADRELYARLYHKLGLYTTRETFAKVMEHTNSRRECLDILADYELTRNKNPRAATAIAELQKRLDCIKHMQPKDAVNEAAAIFRGKRASDQSYAQQPKADMLRAIAQQCRSIKEFLTRMGELAAFSAHERLGAITLSTLHSAKGLEFDRVLLIDAYEDILPARSDSPSAQREKELDEELRLFYVGITRARDELEIITARHSFGEDIIPSRFIGWLSPAPAKEKIGLSANKEKSRTGAYAGNYSEFKPGAHVQHSRFGQGTVTYRDGAVAVVSFGSAEKSIHLPTCCQGGILRVR